MEIKWIHTTGWNWVKEAALTTIHKSSIEGKEITSQWKKDILKSGHSPIRELSIRFKVNEIKRWISDQLVRQKVGVEHYVGTMRSDRGSKPREEQTMADLTEMMQSHNAQSFIQLAQTRLCVGCVSKETRQLAQTIVDKVAEHEPEVAFYCVPPCIASAGCKESAFTTCSYLEHFTDYMRYTGNVVSMFSINQRYTMYHEWRKNSI